MVTLDTLEGIINKRFWYHYDVGNDVLYVRFEAKRQTPTFGEETDDGFVILHVRDQRAE